MKAEKSIWQSVIGYSKTQRIGILLFFAIAFTLQGVYFFYDFQPSVVQDKAAAMWLARQRDLDALKQQRQQYRPTIYPFNPNFITDFKGYKLGMSLEEIDRLLAYRRQNKFVNSAEEFQEVTKVSDSLLKVISPYFKFPDWVKNKKQSAQALTTAAVPKQTKVLVADINRATKEDLMRLYGIGDKLSDRILEQREKLGAFVSMEQMEAIWGLSPEVISTLNKSFSVQSTAGIKKININNATVKELSQCPFFGYQRAKEIVTYRSMQGVIQIEDLAKIKGFPVDKIEIIALYLEF